MLKRVISLLGFCVLLVSVSALASNRETDLKKKPTTSSTKSTTTTKTEITTKVETTKIAPETSVPITPVINAPESGETIEWQVISSGATNNSSLLYSLLGTCGQVAVGYTSSSSYGINQGYWQDFGTPSSCCGLYTSGFSGNCNCSADGKRNLADITRLIDRVYISKLPLCCEENGNVDGDLLAKINLADITRLVDHVYISKAETATCP